MLYNWWIRMYFGTVVTILGSSVDIVIHLVGHKVVLYPKKYIFCDYILG